MNMKKFENFCDGCECIDCCNKDTKCSVCEYCNNGENPIWNCNLKKTRNEVESNEDF